MSRYTTNGKVWWGVSVAEGGVTLVDCWHGSPEDPEEVKFFVLRCANLEVARAVVRAAANDGLEEHPMAHEYKPADLIDTEAPIVTGVWG